MAKTVLPVNFQDDIVNTSMNGKRRYNLIQNTDGTVSLEDVTTYDQVGSNFGAGQINATNKAVNDSADSSKIIDSISDIAANTKAGMMAGALAVKELNGSLGATNNNVAQLQQNIVNVMPGSTYIDIPNPYTAVQDGWAFLTVTGTNEGHVGLICSNGFSYTQPYLKKDAVVHMYIPVRKGQTVSFNGLNFAPNVFRFY